ncbi:MAG: type I-MYXAN CRISPR-associated protein Cas6/Cmx6 [Sulfuricaulis sp.]
MYWQETKDNERYIVPDDIVDVVYNIQCRCLPVDHAYALSQAIARALPWFVEEPGAGLHTIHGAESGNGWMRPERADALLHLSRRTKLTLRLPRQRIDDAAQLSGQTLDVAGNSLQVEKSTVKPLSTITTVFARYIVSRDDADENIFLREAMDRLSGMGVRPKKMLCGMERLITTPERIIHTRSLMLAELAVAEAVKLQQQGLGTERKLGCGLFIPHKGINALQPVLE